MRKPRPGEFVCRCSRYAFPHRFGGGRCTGRFVALKAWADTCCGCAEPCLQCNENAQGECAVVDGRESPEQCDAWQAFVSDNEIVIYKVNWR